MLFFGGWGCITEVFKCCFKGCDRLTGRERGVRRVLQIFTNQDCFFMMGLGEAAAAKTGKPKPQNLRHRFMQNALWRRPSDTFEGLFCGQTHHGRMKSLTPSICGR